MAGLLVFEVLLVSVFTFFIVHEHTRELSLRELRRLEYQANMLALLAQDAIASDRLDLLQKTIDTMIKAPSIAGVRVTDLQGKTISGTNQATTDLTAIEKRYLGVSRAAAVIDLPGDRREAVAPVVVDGRPRALCWVYPNEQERRTELYSQLDLALAFSIIGAVACVLLAEYLARSITRPLARLLQATRRIIRDPADTATLPEDNSTSREVADLTLAFNLMVAAIEEQRTGLNDTLGLLDSMLAHAPIGLAFFDSQGRFVRMNQFFADMNSLTVGKHIGRRVTEIFPGPTGERIRAGIESVFETGGPARDIEVHTGEMDEKTTWLVNIYPVSTATHGIRWVGAVIVDTTGIKRSEDALRRTEKLAVVGQLSSSIAHEINNPLEAITNLLYLMHRLDGLDQKAVSYVEQAQHEVSRMSEIVQETLRFHRQSTRKKVTNIGEVLDSVLTLHRGKVLGQQVMVERRYRPGVELFCFAGEMRQLFANLIGNALDAMPRPDGRLTLDVRYSRSWADPAIEGVRVVIADTGSGMTQTTMDRIFEPFFTTKETTGTGLGLWVSLEIVQKHGGTVRVRSRPADDGDESGTVFMVFFPSQMPDDASTRVSDVQIEAGISS